MSVHIDAEAFERERLARGLTKADVARLAGINPQTISAIAGGRAVSPRTIRAVASVFARTPRLVGADHLFGPDPLVARDVA